MNSVYGLLGLARRAGAVVAGTDAVRASVRAGEARLVVVASDVAEAQLAKLGRSLTPRAVSRVTAGTRAELGVAIGAPPVSAVAVTSPTLAARILSEVDEDGRWPGVPLEAAVAATEG